MQTAKKILNDPYELWNGMIVLGFLLLFIITLIPSWSALASVESWNKVLATPLNPTYCLSSGGLTMSDGWANIKTEITTKGIVFELRYTYDKLLHGDITRVLLQGPRADPNKAISVPVLPSLDAPIALTLCGGERSCNAIEASTCISKNQPDSCRWLLATVGDLDSVTPDQFVGDSAGLDPIRELLVEIEQNPSNFYYVIETDLHGQMLCSPSLGSLAKL